MFEEIAETAKGMTLRAKEASRVRFYLAFEDEKVKGMAEAIEYGNEKRPPKPFMRVTESEHEKEWREAQSAGLSEYVLSGDDEDADSLEEVCKGIAEEMESDYRETAKDMNIPKAVVEGLKVEYSF